MAISNIWTIEGATGGPVTFGSLNLSAAQFDDYNQAADTFTFSQTVDYDADPSFAYGEIVTIYRDEVQFFKGICMQPIRSGSGNSERLQYTLNGPWFQLEKVIYQQDYLRQTDDGDGGFTPITVSLPKIILGTADDGSKVTSEQAITAAINYAVTQLGANALFTLGSLSLPATIPNEELISLSCAEVIKRVLRWFPDRVVWFDYSAATPVLNITARSALTAKTLAIADVTITDNRITAREDLQIDRVVIDYERVDTVNDRQILVYDSDAAGVSSDPLKTLNLYFDLEGSRETILSQRVVANTIRSDSATWWKGHSTRLQGATAITVTDNNESPLVSVNDDGDEETGTSYARELVEGSIAPWMEDVDTWPQVVTASISYTDADGVSHSNEKFRVQLTGTNAATKIYTGTGDFDPAEPTPSGLAAAILSSLNTLQYEGSVTLKQLDVGADRFINKKLNITGGRSAWASMNAQVYSSSFRLDGGETVVNFGPVKHLGATDLFQLIRNTRLRKPANGEMRVTIGGNKELGRNYPNNYSEPDGGSSSAEFSFKIVKVDNSTVKVIGGAINNVVASSGVDTPGPATDGMQLWLKVTRDSEGTVTAVAVQNADPGVDSDTQGKFLLGYVTIISGVLTPHNYHTGLHSVKACGSDYSFWG